MDAWNDIFSQRLLPRSYTAKVSIGFFGSAMPEEKIASALPSATFFSLYCTADEQLGAAGLILTTIARR